MKHELPKLGYEYNALEPFIDEQTMRIHHTKHHQAYVDKLNAALEGHQNLQKKSVEELITDIDSIPEQIRQAVRNNGGGHMNHAFFWPLLKKGTKPSGELMKIIEMKFGSIENFKKEFSAAAIGRFGSGWAWLVISNGELKITTTVNQDSPLTEGDMPIIGIDVWEHAYYLKYQNRRNEYIEAFFNVLNWDRANENLTSAKA